MEGNEFIEFDWTLVRAIWLLVYLKFDAAKIPMIDSYHAFLWQPKFELNCVKTIVFVWQGHVNVNHTRKTALQTTQNTNIDSPNFQISSTSDWGPNCARARWYEKKQNWSALMKYLRKCLSAKRPRPPEDVGRAVPDLLYHSRGTQIIRNAPLADSSSKTGRDHTEGVLDEGNWHGDGRSVADD